MSLHTGDWEDCEIDTFDISLDKENPRIPESRRANQDYIRSHMISYEGVLELASKISDWGGLFPHERIIVIQEKGEYVVVEGNRRVCASYILLRPWLAGDDEVI